MSTSSILNGFPPGACHTFPALKPSLAWMIGAQPAQTLRAKRTVSFSSGL